MVKKIFGNMFKKQSLFQVIGGNNYLPRSSQNVYMMICEEKAHGEGVVLIEEKLFYFLGAYKEQAHSRSAGKAAAGAIIGGALTGGAGAIVGAAIGGKKQDDSLFWIDFMDYETKQEFSVQVKPNDKLSKNEISEFRPANPLNLGLE